MSRAPKNRFRAFVALAAVAPMLGACQNAESHDAPGDTEPTTTARPAAPALPSGTTLSFAVDNEISTKTNHKGDQFLATLTSDAQAPDGSVILPAGTKGRWLVSESTNDGADGQAVLAVRLEAINMNGRWEPLDATVTGTDIKVDKADSGGETAAKIGVGAAAGALVGQILGKSTDATLKGAGVGAAVGTVVALTSRSGSATIPAGSHIEVRLDQRLAASS